MNLIIILFFIAGYFLIAFERNLKLNKAASAVVMGVVCWTLLMLNSTNKIVVMDQLMTQLSDITSILFFLLGAMTIVELIESHGGFDIISRLITTKNKKKLLWIISFATFFLSAVLDNLTTSIIMIVLIRKLVPEEDRLVFAGAIVIAANAGGAWSPIGDVTTTMLWIGQRITSWNIIRSLFIPSIINMIVPLLFLTKMVKGKADFNLTIEADKLLLINNVEKYAVLVSGIVLLILVPVFKSVTHLPPFMGMLLALGILWMITEMLHKKKKEVERYQFSVLNALRKLDMTTVFFFLGILLAVASLQSAEILSALSEKLDMWIGNYNIVAVIIGAVSSIVDNVPLVAAAIGMYPASLLPVDHTFWRLLAYSAGTGGSILIIGSAAGVAVMGLEKIGFIQYMKKIGPLALLGYLVGAGSYLLFGYLIH